MPKNKSDKFVSTLIKEKLRISYFKLFQTSLIQTKQCSLRHYRDAQKWLSKGILLSHDSIWTGTSVKFLGIKFCRTNRRANYTNSHNVNPQFTP